MLFESFYFQIVSFGAKTEKIINIHLLNFKLCVHCTLSFDFTVHTFLIPPLSKTLKILINPNDPTSLNINSPINSCCFLGYEMELNGFEPIFKQPKTEWSDPNSTRLGAFMLCVDAPDSSKLRIEATDFDSTTWETILSVDQLDNMVSFSFFFYVNILSY